MTTAIRMKLGWIYISVILCFVLILMFILIRTLNIFWNYFRFVCSMIQFTDGISLWCNNRTICFNNHECTEICGLKCIFLLQCFIWIFKSLSCVHLSADRLKHNSFAGCFLWYFYCLFIIGLASSTIRFARVSFLALFYLLRCRRPQQCFSISLIFYSR